MTERLMDQLLRALSSANPPERERAADETTDVHRGLSDEDVSRLVRALVSARMHETDAACQEAQLNALCDLATGHDIHEELLRPLSSLIVRDLPRGQAEYLTALLGEEV
jgi:hypothetical protein